MSERYERYPLVENGNHKLLAFRLNKRHGGLKIEETVEE
jgi:hypothetical protein